FTLRFWRGLIAWRRPASWHRSERRSVDHFSFSHQLISAVARMPQQQVDDALLQLVRAELIFQHGTPPDAEYSFKHALVQDGAYSTLLRGRRSWPNQCHAGAGIFGDRSNTARSNSATLHGSESGRESSWLLAQGGPTSS